MTDDLISKKALMKEFADFVRRSNNSDFAPTPTWNDAVSLVGSMPSAQPEQRWIPCSERLPKQGQKVICRCRANIIKVLKLDADGDWYEDADHCYMGGFVIA